MNKVCVEYFSDILCIWAYINQIKIKELKSNFQNNIEINYHFTDTFYSVNEKLTTSWAHRGGASEYAKHIKDLKESFPHIKIHPDIWTKNVPTSSSNAHIFLKAIDQIHSKEILEN